MGKEKRLNHNHVGRSKGRKRKETKKRGDQR